MMSKDLKPFFDLLNSLTAEEIVSAYKLADKADYKCVDPLEVFDFHNLVLVHYSDYAEILKRLALWASIHTHIENERAVFPLIKEVMEQPDPIGILVAVRGGGAYFLPVVRGDYDPSDYVMDSLRRWHFSPPKNAWDDVKALLANDLYNKTNWQVLLVKKYLEKRKGMT